MEFVFVCAWIYVSEMVCIEVIANLYLHSAVSRKSFCICNLLVPAITDVTNQSCIIVSSINPGSWNDVITSKVWTKLGGRAGARSKSSHISAKHQSHPSLAFFVAHRIFAEHSARLPRDRPANLLSSDLSGYLVSRGIRKSCLDEIWIAVLNYKSKQSWLSEVRRRDV